MAQRRRAMFALLLLLAVPTPACSQCTTCNQQPSQVYYNSQVAVQPANQARPGQFQPPSSVSRNQQIYVWYGQPQPIQNQMNQALGVNPAAQNGVPQQTQYNPNYNNNNNQQPVMYNNINRDQPNYANQPYANPAVQQQVSPRPNPSAAGFAPQGVPSTAFPYSTTTPAYNTVAPLAPIQQSFDQPPPYLNAGSTTAQPPYYGPTSTATPPVTSTGSSTASSQFASSPSSPVPSPYLAEGFTPTPSPPTSNTNDTSSPIPLPVVFPSPSIPSSSVNVVSLPPASSPQSNTVIISQTYSGPATAPGLNMAPNPNQATSFSQTVVEQGPTGPTYTQTVASQGPNGPTGANGSTFSQTIVGTNPGSDPNQPAVSTINQTVVDLPASGQPSSVSFSFVGPTSGTDQESGTGLSGANQFGSDQQLPLTNQASGTTIAPLPVIFPANSAASNPSSSGTQFQPNPAASSAQTTGAIVPNQGGSSGAAFQPNPNAPASQPSGNFGPNQGQSGQFQPNPVAASGAGPTGSQFQPNPSQSASVGQSSTAFVQDSGPAVARPVGSAPLASNDFSLQPNPNGASQVQQQPGAVYNPALVTSQTAPVSAQYDPNLQQQQQQQQQFAPNTAAAAVGGGSAAVAAAALAAAAAAAGSSNSTLRPVTTTPFAYSTQFSQGTPMPTLQPVSPASQSPLVTGTSMQPVATSTPAYNPSPSPSTAFVPSSSPSSPTPSSSSRIPSSTTAFPSSTQQIQVLQPSQQLAQQPQSSTAQPSTSQVYPTTYYPSTTTQAPFTSTYPTTTTTYYPSTTTMAPMTSTYPTTTMSPYPSTLTPAQQQQQQVQQLSPYVLGNTQQQQATSTFAPYSSTYPSSTSTPSPVQIGYNPAGQPVQQQQQPYYPTSTQAPFVSSTPSAPYAQSTTPYGSPYPMTGTPVNQGAIGVNNVQGTTPYYPSTTPAPTQPFYNPTTTQQPFNQGLQGVTGSPVYQIGQGVPGNTPQYNPPGSMSSTYSPYAASGSTLGNQVLYDPSTGLSTANGMNTMYGKYTTMEPGSQMMRDVPIANGGPALSLLTGIAALVFLF